MYCQDHKLRRKLLLTPQQFKHIWGAYVRLTPLQHVTSERINFNGLQVRAIDAYKYHFTKGRTFHTTNLHPNHKQKKPLTSYCEVAIDERVLRIILKTNCLNLKITNDLFTPQRKKKSALMLSNDELNKSIIKNKENGRQSPASASTSLTPNNNKAVSFNNTFYITPISPRNPQHQQQTTPRPQQQQNSYENTFKEYLKKMNGSTSDNSKTQETAEIAPPPPIVVEVEQPPPAQAAAATPKDDDIEDEDGDEEMEVEMLDDEPPRRGRGRPRGSGRLKQFRPPRPPPRDPNTPPKRRGWPLGLPRKKFTTYKNVHRPYGEPQPVAATQQARRGPGRPRKILAFGFQTIVTDIKSVNLPSELWSAHVSVTSKRAQVCFTRVVQNKAVNLPVECDRSVKFNGTVKYLVRINNRDVALVAAPPIVNSIKEIEILLNIVNDISQNDPILEYFNR